MPNQWATVQVPSLASFNHMDGHISSCFLCHPNWVFCLFFLRRTGDISSRSCGDQNQLFSTGMGTISICDCGNQKGCAWTQDCCPEFSLKITGCFTLSNVKMQARTVITLLACFSTTRQVRPCNLNCMTWFCRNVNMVRSQQHSLYPGDCVTSAKDSRLSKKMQEPVRHS